MVGSGIGRTDLPQVRQRRPQPQRLVDELIGRGFSKARVERLANLEDVFLDLTGHDLREED
jgi:tRNA isopentenyl-2-thiomethyl-A-37 hydroxylase MiaE